MNPLLKEICDFFCPIHILTLFHRKNYKSLHYPNQTVDACDRLNWARWLENFNYLVIDKDRISLPMSYEVSKKTKPTFPPFSNTTKNKVTINILDIKGVSSSKSDLSKYSDLKIMAKERSPEMITLSVEELLKWHEFRFDSTDYISVYSWDCQPYLMQTGGSHHFASAQYRSAELSESHYITLPLEEISLDLNTIQSLLTKVALIYTSNIEESMLLSDALDKTNINHTRVSTPYNNRESSRDIGEVFVISLQNFKHRYVANQLKRVFDDLGETLISQAKRPYKTWFNK
ncbi:DUF6685 family protein [Vibrio sp. R78045]|uniref:DUF6685 family protein n=1 Tax=Vibrio sp. R78045 TaxID=3093868 RepID=UPI0036F353BC